jgi:hypothetical protein
MFKLALIAAAALMLPTALFPQTASADGFKGSWKLNTAKSKFDPGPALKSETVTVSADGKTEIQQVTGDGKEARWSFVPSAGGTVPIEGVEGATVMEKKKGGHTLDHTWKFPDFKGTAHGVLSQNGKTLTYVMRGTNDNGKPVHNLMFFEKQ